MGSSRSQKLSEFGRWGDVAGLCYFLRLAGDCFFFAFAEFPDALLAGRRQDGLRNATRDGGRAEGNPADGAYRAGRPASKRIGRCTLDFELVDAQGRRCPTDEGRVDFAIEGPGIWRGGYNSGIPGSVNNLYLNDECGINRVSIRSTLKPGTITLTARRESLTSATVTIPSHAVEIQNGLSQAMPTEARIAFDQSMAPTAGD